MSKQEQKTVTLTDGRKFIIERPGLMALQSVFRSLPVITADLPTDAAPVSSGNAMADRVGYMVELLCVACVQPRLVKKKKAGDNDPNVLAIDDLGFKEAIELFHLVDEFIDWDGSKAKLDPSSATSTPS